MSTEDQESSPKLSKKQMRVSTNNLQPGDFILDSNERWEIMIPPPGLLVERVETTADPREGYVTRIWFKGYTKPEIWNPYYSWQIEREKTDG